MAGCREEKGKNRANAREKKPGLANAKGGDGGFPGCGWKERREDFRRAKERKRKIGVRWIKDRT